MTERSQTCETLDLIARLQMVLARADLDGSCRELLSGAIERFSGLEAQRLSRRSLLRARDHRARIAAILALLSELNQLTENEKDRTVFVEMALLFDEIGQSATAGAAALRDIDPPLSARSVAVRGQRHPAIAAGSKGEANRPDRPA